MGRYRRTVSFPNPNPNPNPTPKSYHVRSVSLPCGRTHPLIPQLRDLVTELHAWVGTGNNNRADSTRLVSGMTRLKSVLDSLDDVLQLPQTLEALSTQRNVVERLLEDFLKFVDVYEVFHEAMLGLKQEVCLAQVSARKNGGSKLGLVFYVKAHKKIASEVGKLISSVGSISDRSNSILKPSSTAQADFHDELGSVIYNVHRLIVSVSETVFGGVSGSFGPCRKSTWAGLGFGLKRARKEVHGVEEFVKVLEGVENLLELNKKIKNNKNINVNININENEVEKMKLLKRMKEMEECVGEMERESERVFRSLISNRVSLLNILTHA